MQYTFHADNRGHVSLIDHMLVSECLIHVRNSVIIHMDDSNVSDLLYYFDNVAKLASV